MKLKNISLLGLSLLIGFSSCNSIRNFTAVTADNFPTFSAEAHRGGRGLNPENSIIAMKAAIAMDYITTLEMDCHITKDKRVVVYHDHYLNPKFVTYSDGKEIPSEKKNIFIYNLNYSELQKYDIGSKVYADFPQQHKTPTKVALLSELIDSAEAHAAKKGRKPMFYNIETKSKEGADGKYHPAPKEFVDLMVQVIIEKGIGPRTVIQSFDKRTIQYLHKTYPQLKTSFLIDASKKTTAKEVVQELGFTPFIISPNYKLVTKAFVKDFRSYGMKVIPWTANDAKQIKALKALKVDGIITDYPNLLK